MKGRTLPIGRHYSRLGVLCALLAGAAQAEGDPLADLLAELVEGPGTACHVAVAEQRITEWRDGPPVQPAFETIDEIMEPVEASTRAIIDSGCKAEFVYSFQACTQVDDPLATHIVPRGVAAETDAEFADILRDCFATLEAEGIRP